MSGSWSLKDACNKKPLILKIQTVHGFNYGHDFTNLWLCKLLLISPPFATSSHGISLKLLIFRSY